MKRFLLLVVPVLALVAVFAGQLALAQNSAWHQATSTELASLLPARAPVIKEHIETEMRTASGIVDRQAVLQFELIRQAEQFGEVRPG